MADTFYTDPTSGYTFNQYPTDVDYNTRHGNNFCVFYINVPALSNIAGSGNNTILSTNGTRAQAGKFLTRIAGNNAAAGLGTTSKRTKTAIKLYMPNQIQLNHNIKYENAGLGLLGGLATLDKNITYQDALKSAGIQAASNFGSLAGKIATAAGFEGLGTALDSAQRQVANVAQALTGISINPHLETLFQGVEFRKFNFIYDFFPRDKDEQQEVKEIINLFRFHMHPELFDPNGANRAFITPSEFDISFYSNSDLGGTENNYLFAISTCALQNVSVDYTATGMWSAHQEGAPVGIRLTLNFQELEIMTKDRLTELEFERFNSINSTTSVFGEGL